MSLNGAGSLSSAEASLCCGEAGDKEKESARGTMGRGNREERLPPFPSSHRSPRAFYFSIIAIFIGIPQTRTQSLFMCFWGERKLEFRLRRARSRTFP